MFELRSIHGSPCPCTRALATSSTAAAVGFRDETRGQFRDAGGSLAVTDSRGGAYGQPERNRGGLHAPVKGAYLDPLVQMRGEVERSGDVDSIQRATSGQSLLPAHDRLDGRINRFERDAPEVLIQPRNPSGGPIRRRG